MIKIIVSVMAVLIIAGCATQKNASVPYRQFQMVDTSSAILVQSGKDKGDCYICGMDLVRFYKTSHASEHKDKKFQYCSIHCLEDHLGQGVTLKNPKVVDVASLKFISVSQAHYVVGSKKRGTMTRVSKYAFLNLADAKSFQAKNGGDIMDFVAAREKAKEDFKHYKN